MKILKKMFLAILCILLILFAVYMLGPKPGKLQLTPEAFSLSEDLALVEQMVDKDAKTPGLKSNNASRLIWADSFPGKTDFVLLYLHGFSASPEEGYDMAVAFSRRYHCNVYLPRLFGHGLTEDEPMLNMDANQLFQSASQALAIAQKLGKQVIIMGTSTGATLALPLAAQNPDIHSFIFYSPNFGLADPNAKWLSKPWGLQIARRITGSNNYRWETDDYGQKYWTTEYRLEGLVQLQSLLDHCVKPELFSQLKQPVFIGYYFKDEQHQDDAISVSSILTSQNWFGTPATQKWVKAFPEAEGHVICNPNSSKAFEEVQAATFSFAEEILGLSPKPLAGYLP